MAEMAKMEAELERHHMFGWYQMVCFTPEPIQTVGLQAHLRQEFLSNGVCSPKFEEAK